MGSNFKGKETKRKKEKRGGFDKPSSFFIPSLSSFMSSTFRGKTLVVISRIGIASKKKKKKSHG